MAGSSAGEAASPRGAGGAFDASVGQHLLRPILATGVGRGGTTMLMLQLGRDPRCLFNRTYAFGTLWLSYFAKFSHMLLRDLPEGREPPVHVTNLNDPGFGTLHVPVVRTAEDLTIDKARILLALWREVSEASRETHPGALFYAEKARVWVSGLLRELMPSYTVYQLRDPRDVFLSQLSFMKKSPGVTFGKHWDDSTRALALSGRFLELVENYIQDRQDSCCIVRYEDLAANPDDPLPELQRATGWQPSEPMPMEYHAKHRSSHNAGDSIQRWKREEIPAAAMSDIAMALGRSLTDFGYEPTTGSVPSVPLRLDLGERAALDRLGDVHHGDFTGIEERGARFSITGSRFHITVPLDARTSRRIRQVWVCVSEGLDGTCAVYWRKQHEAFSSERCSDKPYATGRHTSILRFPVQEHKAWSRDPSELRLALFNTHHALSKPGTAVIRWIMVV